MLLIALAVAAAQPPLPLQWAQFSRSGARSRVSETVDIATGKWTRNGAFPYRLRFTRRSPNTAIEVKWADSERCSAIRPVIASMRDITMPRPAPYGILDDKLVIVADGAGYELTAPSCDATGTITITSNVESPLADWIDASLDTLAYCWTAEP